MMTVQISGGRSNKLRPGDILGTLTSEPGSVPSSDIGKIEILDRYSYVAIKSQMAEKALNKLRSAKIKGTKFKAFLA
jgi:ATP-independent RNA helicase DbpA